MAWPTVKLELDINASGGVTRSWQDITAYLRHYKIDYGRQFELNTFGTGTQEYTVDNTSGWARMFNTAGAFYPNLKCWRRLRFSMTWNSVQTFLGYGYLQSIVPTRAGNYSEVVMKCADAFSIFALRQLIPTSVSGSNGDLSITSRSVAVAGVGGGKARHRWLPTPPPGALAAPPATMPTQVQLVTDPAADPGTGNVSVDTTTGIIKDSFQAGTAPTGRRASRIAYDLNSHGITSQMIQATALTDNHIDNATITLAGALAAQRSDLRIAAVLNLIGWPAGDRLIGTGTNTIQPTSFATADDVKSLQHMQDVATSELGQLFMDGQNRVVFQGQGARAAAPFNTVGVVFSDAPATSATPPEFGYDDVTPSEDNQYIYNHLFVSRNGGATVTLNDSASVTDNNQVDLSYSTILSTDAALTTLGNTLLTRYKTQRLRYDQVVLTPSGSDMTPGPTTSLWDWLLSLGISNRVTIKENPPGSSALATDCFIEKITHEGDGPGAESFAHSTTYALSPV